MTNCFQVLHLYSKRNINGKFYYSCSSGPMDRALQKLIIFQKSSFLLLCIYKRKTEFKVIYLHFPSMTPFIFYGKFSTFIALKKQPDWNRHVLFIEWSNTTATYMKNHVKKITIISFYSSKIIGHAYKWLWRGQFLIHHN